MQKVKETVLGLKYMPNEKGIVVLHQKVLVVDEHTKEEYEVWEPIEGAADVPLDTKFSERFKHDTFKPHNIEDVKTSPISKRLKLVIDYTKETKNVDTVNMHIERSLRLDQVLQKLLKSPEILKQNGFDFKGNVELKKALTIICDEMGGDWIGTSAKFI